jgi:hypothetical protein
MDEVAEAADRIKKRPRADRPPVPDSVWQELEQASS